MIKLVIALMLAGSSLMAEDAVWGTDGSYQGYTQDNGSYFSVWGNDGSYKGFIQKSGDNPYVEKIDRGR